MSRFAAVAGRAGVPAARAGAARSNRDARARPARGAHAARRGRGALRERMGTAAAASFSTIWDSRSRRPAARATSATSASPRPPVRPTSGPADASRDRPPARPEGARAPASASASASASTSSERPGSMASTQAGPRYMGDPRYGAHRASRKPEPSGGAVARSGVPCSARARCLLPTWRSWWCRRSPWCRSGWHRRSGS